MNYKVSADVVEVNRYQFYVEADSKEEAEKRLTEYLDVQCPNIHQDVPLNGVICYDRESAMETKDTISVKAE